VCIVNTTNWLNLLLEPNVLRPEAVRVLLAQPASHEQAASHHSCLGCLHALDQGCCDACSFTGQGVPSPPSSRSASPVPAATSPPAVGPPTGPALAACSSLFGSLTAPPVPAAAPPPQASPLQRKSSPLRPAAQQPPAGQLGSASGLAAKGAASAAAKRAALAASSSLYGNFVAQAEACREPPRSVSMPEGARRPTLRAKPPAAAATSTGSAMATSNLYSSLFAGISPIPSGDVDDAEAAAEAEGTAPAAEQATTKTSSSSLYSDLFASLPSPGGGAAPAAVGTEAAAPAPAAVAKPSGEAPSSGLYSDMFALACSRRTPQVLLDVEGEVKQVLVNGSAEATTAVEAGALARRRRRSIEAADQRNPFAAAASSAT
jgi:hypothetical protein